MTKGLSHPWAIAFLPDGGMLVTERPGRLRIVRDGVLDPQAISGVPEVRTDGNGGSWMSLSIPSSSTIASSTSPIPSPWGNGRGAPALARGRLEAGALTDVRDLLVTDPFEGNSGLNGRVAFGRDGKVYMSTGGRGRDARARSHEPAGQGPASQRRWFRAERQPVCGPRGPSAGDLQAGTSQHTGLVVHPETGELWQHENGPNGGDEINIVLPGRNYGWPVVSFGRDYSGARLYEPTREGMETPLVVWLPAIAAAGMTVYTGDEFSCVEGERLRGIPAPGRHTGHGPPAAHRVHDRTEELRRESMLTQLRQRIREVREGPDGFLYLLTDEDDGALLRIEPAP